MIKKLNNRGFSHIEMFLLVLVIASISGVGYYVFTKSTKTAHAGNQVLATIDTPYLGSYNITGCMATPTSLTSTASITSSGVNQGFDGGVSSFFVSTTKDPSQLLKAGFDHGRTLPDYNNPTYVIGGTADSYSSTETWFNKVTTHLSTPVAAGSKIYLSISYSNAFSTPKVHDTLYFSPAINVGTIVPCTTTVSSSGTTPTPGNTATPGSGTTPSAADSKTVSSKSTTPAPIYGAKSLPTAPGGSKVITTIKTKYAYDFVIIGCSEKTNGKVTKIDTVASYLSPLNVATGFDGSISTYYIESGKVVAGSKDSSTGGTTEWVNGTSAALSIIPSKNMNVTFGISTSNAFAKIKNDLGSTTVDISSIPECSVANANTPTSKGATVAYLLSGQELTSNDQLISSNNKYKMVMQSDGNLVVYNIKSNHSKWESGTSGHAGAYATLRNDGNLVIYNQNAKLIWQTNTIGFQNDIMTLSNAGYIILGNKNHKVWTTAPPPPPPAPARQVTNNISPKDAQYKGNSVLLQTPDNSYNLVMQTDGNLVEYGSNGVSYWSTGTDNNPGAYAIFQSDGNFVVYSSTNQVLWSTGTNGNPGDTMSIDSSGVITIKTSSNTQIWPMYPPAPSPIDYGGGYGIGGSYGGGDSSGSGGGGVIVTTPPLSNVVFASCMIWYRPTNGSGTSWEATTPNGYGGRFTFNDCQHEYETVDVNYFVRSQGLNEPIDHFQWNGQNYQTPPPRYDPAQGRTFPWW